MTTMVIGLIALAGCGSSKKHVERGNYDTAVSSAVAKLRKKPDSRKDIIALEQAMNIALEQDNERIRYLKTEGRADSWDEIYLIYKKMSDRQSAVRTVTPLNYQGRVIEWPYVDYMQEMVTAKKRAADFYYAHGQELMKNDTRESYRQAYYEFVRVREYAGDYPGLDGLIQDAKYLGTSRVYVTLKNYSLINFPQEFEKELLALDLPRLNSDWVEFHTSLPGEDIRFDYLVNVSIRLINVSPDRQFQHDTLIRRSVEDGFDYVKDARGNVAKDSLGNDIKVKRYKDLQCALIETFQVKECHIEGDTEIIELYPERTVRKEPLGAAAAFEHISARAIGDEEALSAEQKQMLKQKPVEFPSDMEMIFMCSENLKMAIRGFMNSNRRYIN